MPALPDEGGRTACVQARRKLERGGVCPANAFAAQQRVRGNIDHSLLTKGDRRVEVCHASMDEEKTKIIAPIAVICLRPPPLAAPAPAPDTPPFPHWLGSSEPLLVSRPSRTFPAERLNLSSRFSQFNDYR